MCRSQPGDWKFANPLLLTNLCIPNLIGCLTINSFKSIIVPFRSCDWNSPVPLFLTVRSFPNPGDLCNQLFLTDFLWFIPLIRAFNQLLLTNCCFLTCDWKFCAHDLYPGFSFPIHTEYIQISPFSLIFKVPIVKWESSRYIIANIPLGSDMRPFSPNPSILYCYNFNEFFIPHLYFYRWGIPEILSLIFHSFLVHDRTVPNPPILYCYNFNEFFIPRPYCYRLRIPELLLLTLHSFHVSDHAIDNIQPMLLLTLTFYHQPMCVVFLFPITIFAYISRCLFSDLLIRAYNIFHYC